MSKSAMGPINNSKNKLNSEIILIFYFNPNAHIIFHFKYMLMQHKNNILYMLTTFVQLGSNFFFLNPIRTNLTPLKVSQPNSHKLCFFILKNFNLKCLLITLSVKLTEIYYIKYTRMNPTPKKKKTWTGPTYPNQKPKLSKIKITRCP